MEPFYQIRLGLALRLRSLDMVRHGWILICDCKVRLPWNIHSLSTRRCRSSVERFLSNFLGIQVLVTNGKDVCLASRTTDLRTPQGVDWPQCAKNGHLAEWRSNKYSYKLKCELITTLYSIIPFIKLRMRKKVTSTRPAEYQ